MGSRASDETFQKWLTLQAAEGCANVSRQSRALHGITRGAANCIKVSPVLVSRNSRLKKAVSMLAKFCPNQVLWCSLHVSSWGMRGSSLQQHLGGQSPPWRSLLCGCILLRAKNTHRCGSVLGNMHLENSEVLPGVGVEVAKADA